MVTDKRNERTENANYNEDASDHSDNPSPFRGKKDQKPGKYEVEMLLDSQTPIVPEVVNFEIMKICVNIIIQTTKHIEAFDEQLSGMPGKLLIKQSR